MAKKQTLRQYVVAAVHRTEDDFLYSVGCFADKATALQVAADVAEIADPTRFAAIELCDILGGDDNAQSFPIAKPKRKHSKGVRSNHNETT